MNNIEYGVYVTVGPNGYKSTEDWGGDHITVSRTEKYKHEKTLRNIVNDVAEMQIGKKNWRPKTWTIQEWKGRQTMVISSKRLPEVARLLKEKGALHLMGPENKKCKFHVTLPETIKNPIEAQKYATELSKKDWFLTVVKKDGHNHAEWINYTLLKQ